MAKKKPKAVLYRRKKELKTNYLKRLKLLLCRKPRVVVRFTNRKIIAQIVEFTSTSDKVLMGVDSSHLKKQGWNYSLKNTPAAYLTGLLLGKVAAGKYADLVLDTGFKLPLKKGKTYAFLKGLLDAGLNVYQSDKKSIYPDDKRITGEHIVSYAAGLKENKLVYNKVFAQYLKESNSPENITKCFNEVKRKIVG